MNDKNRPWLVKRECSGCGGRMIVSIESAYGEFCSVDCETEYTEKRFTVNRKKIAEKRLEQQGSHLDILSNEIENEIDRACSKSRSRLSQGNRRYRVEVLEKYELRRTYIVEAKNKTEARKMANNMEWDDAHDGWEFDERPYYADENQIPELIGASVKGEVREEVK